MQATVEKQELEELFKNAKELDKTSITILTANVMTLKAYQDLQKEGK